MRARDRDVSGAAFGLRRGLVGTGDGLEAVPGSLEEAIRAATAQHGAKAGRMLRAFAELPDGVFVWTRDDEGAYHLGRVAGPWSYDDSAEAREVGIHHVRPARWLDRPFGDGEVPAAVAETFARGGRNLQRTRSDAAEQRTEALWAEHAG